MNDVLRRITDELSKQRYKDKDLCDYVGISQSTFSTWKSKDRQPKPDQLPLIAEFLGVTLDYLMTGQKEPARPSLTSSATASNPQLTARDERDIAKDLDSIMSKIRSGEEGPLRYNGEEIDEESLQLLEDAIGMSLRHLKIINKEKYNPHKNKK